MTLKNVFFILFTALLLTSCGTEHTDLESFISETKLTGSAKVKALPDYIAYEKFVYVSDGIRDPFVAEKDIPVIIVEDEQGIKDEFAPNVNRKKETLELFPIDTLQMVGTLEKEFNWALIRTSDGDIHRVKIGNYLGQNFGEIIQLTDNKITVKEVIKDGLGDWIERFASITMGE